ncbi:hypothetical protein Mesci_3806 [Mesorhizobium ciceri biovar biserrulae WSM1271]|uniref:Uncharacterized protein n=1 Tax=Mesorhizobium ciceri biovar biserrulae (strain HAMBI 2942 / LMG 23838 / WSM1271) TaxID=765698 RepID=E8T7S2_MESCW|nr:hypothetical protein Mesci_3806 [Mesorhizobium ciceri biovar biserrulae WSM1271]
MHALKRLIAADNMRLKEDAGAEAPLAIAPAIMRVGKTDF